MAHINQSKGYELKYWNAHKHETYDRADVILSLFDIPFARIAADVGSGPRGGIFHSYRCPVMYAVDPLWSEYKDQKLSKIPKKVEIINNEAEHFSLPQPADFILSVNALDHSGSLRNSVNNIMRNLKVGGMFFFHVHMRTKKQLNKGHRMLITEDALDKIFVPYDVVKKEIHPKCPIEGKPYRSYVTTVRKPSLK